MTMNSRCDVVVALNGGAYPNGELLDDTKERVDTAVEAAIGNNIGHIAMVGGDSLQMYEYAVTEYSEVTRLPDLLFDDYSRDTIGNAHFAKKNVLEPYNWHNILLVTANFHLPRAEWTFRKVLGEEYNVGTEGSDNTYNDEELARLKLKEIGLWAASRLILAGVTPQQDVKRERRLKAISPRYDGQNPVQRFVGLLDRSSTARV